MPHPPRSASFFAMMDERLEWISVDRPNIVVVVVKRLGAKELNDSE
mgnify:FL=1